MEEKTSSDFSTHSCCLYDEGRVPDLINSQFVLFSDQQFLAVLAIFSCLEKRLQETTKSKSICATKVTENLPKQPNTYHLACKICDF